MKKIAVALGLVASMTASVSAADTIRLGSDFTYPPFNYKDKEQNPTGFDIEIADALCKEAQLDCEWETISWDGLIPSLLSRKIDVIMASMRITEDRKKRVLFTDRYYKTPAQFAGLASRSFDISEEGLEGLRVGVQMGTIHDRYVTDQFGDVVDVVRYPGQEEVYNELANGRLDLVFANSDQIMLSFLNTEHGEGYEFVGEPVTDKEHVGEGTALALRPRDEELAQKLNAAIAEIRANGTYDEIASRYFNFDIYGD
ncbi:transporter substrate-binding domain-containing protein [Marinobacter salinisoli]|uniref:Transporter substrate-binding domain-containing protein n=1 Tax=Marinobacter salinisoli TaxID=2769486 RepID=A0ABX7MW93_9GAMM|nr:transporter substrate-binding domain-containing protein [Marinobacter salinisoli]QSP95762.1 transporter substrate-binding domain-containing protein [Marinobacter salinisoli]